MLNSTQNIDYPIILRSQIFTNACGNLVNLKREVMTLAVPEKAELKLWKKTYPCIAFSNLHGADGHGVLAVVTRHGNRQLTLLIDLPMPNGQRPRANATLQTPEHGNDVLTSAPSTFGNATGVEHQHRAAIVARCSTCTSICARGGGGRKGC
ncbi:hypothetical protein NQ318_014589 [Aromia moschata]|uniref:Uncharacterized protein n=1 Tax=Aromia moschata TaxID=1265417 RepID=A0AAV8ZB50_9CUCU|nr:hypothetical protein NQ318_014589 [Aromia moschata]